MKKIQVKEGREGKEKCMERKREGMKQEEKTI